MSLVLGLDCGGTKTSAVVVRDGVEIGRGFGGPANLATCAMEQFSESIRAAAEQAMAAALCGPDTLFDGVGAAMAGYSASKRHAEADASISTFVQTRRCVLMPDYEAALWGAAPNGVGVAAIAGTGAVVFGRNREGKALRMDGLGFLLGDRGGGADVGIQCLQFVAFELQHEPPKDQSSFVRLVLDYVGAAGLGELLEQIYTDFSVQRLAAVGGYVLNLSEEGNTLAKVHVQNAAFRLRTTTDKCRNELGIECEPVYLLGGYAGASAVYREAFAGCRDTVSLSTPANDAAYGAALMAVL